MKAQKIFNDFSPITRSDFPASVAAENAYNKVSNRYNFLSTLQVTDSLAEVGLFPYLIQQQGTRIEDKAGYTKHLMRFRSSGVPAIQGNVYPEVVLLNAHDRASSFTLELGLFRCACLNGLMVSFGNWGKYRIRHVASSISDVLLAAQNIVELFPMIESRVSTMQGIALDYSQRLALAEKAMLLRWENEKQPFQASTLLQSRRMADEGLDLWTTYNVIQENLLKGQKNVRRYSHSGVRQHNTREIKSIDLQMSVNKGLWELAESFVECNPIEWKG